MSSLWHNIQVVRYRNLWQLRACDRSILLNQVSAVSGMTCRQITECLERISAWDRVISADIIDPELVISEIIASGNSDTSVVSESAAVVRSLFDSMYLAKSLVWQSGVDATLILLDWLRSWTRLTMNIYLRWLYQLSKNIQGISYEYYTEVELKLSPSVILWQDPSTNIYYERLRRDVRNAFMWYQNLWPLDSSIVDTSTRKTSPWLARGKILYCATNNAQLALEIARNEASYIDIPLCSLLVHIMTNDHGYIYKIDDYSEIFSLFDAQKTSVFSYEMGSFLCNMRDSRFYKFFVRDFGSRYSWIHGNYWVALHMNNGSSTQKTPSHKKRVTNSVTQGSNIWWTSLAASVFDEARAAWLSYDLSYKLSSWQLDRKFWSTTRKPSRRRWFYWNEGSHV